VKRREFFIVILFTHIAVYLAILSGLQLFRAVVGFIYLMFLPGFVILRLFRLKNLGAGEKVLFSVSLSIAFLMGVGLILDFIVPLTGFNHPLSTDLIIISISVILLPLSLITIDDDAFKMGTRKPETLFFIALSIFFFILGVCGILMLNDFGDNLLLLLLIFLIAIVFLAASASERFVPSHIYPLILVVSCLALLLFVGTDTALVTNYLTGSGDQWIEFYSFRSTDILSQWVSTATVSPNRPDLLQTYSMLSVTILPTIFERITGIDSSWIFKLLYPILICFMALGTYALYNTQTDKKVAFLATFFFIAVSVGKGWGSDKQLVAQLFFVALFLLIFKKGLPRLKRDILFIIFSAGLVVSHYALSYIFMLVMLFAWSILTVVDYIREGSFSIEQEKIPFHLVLIYLVIAFSWYTFVNSSTAFNLLFQTANTVVSNIGQFFNLQSRGTALVGLGIVQAPTVLNQISTYLFLFTEFLVVFGFIWIVMRRSSTSFAPEYKVVVALNIAIISVNILLPRLADSFLMSRFYQTTLIVLAPLAVVGGKAILEHIPRMKPRFLFPILAFVIFVPFFLFQTGFVYEVAGVQNDSLTLDMHRWDNMKLYDVIVDSQEVLGAVWISEHANVASLSMLADIRAGYSLLTAYGLIGRGQISLLSNNTNIALRGGQFIFLRQVNAMEGKIEGMYVFNASQISTVFENQNKVYSTDGCEIYEGYPP
jgi:uncharacterized membrane protein